MVSRLSLVPSIHISWGTEELLCCHCHLLHELGTLMNKISIISHIPDNCPEAYFTPSPTLYYKMRILGHHLNWAILCLERPEQSMVTTFNCWYVWVSVWIIRVALVDKKLTNLKFLKTFSRFQSFNMQSYLKTTEWRST